jgi:hypothetical protein
MKQCRLFPHVRCGIEQFCGKLCVAIKAGDYAQTSVMRYPDNVMLLKQLAFREPECSQI